MFQEKQTGETSRVLEIQEMAKVHSRHSFSLLLKIGLSGGDFSLDRSQIEFELSPFPRSEKSQ